MRKIVSMVAVVAAAVTSPLQAEEAAAGKLWTGEVALGYLQSAGNTSTTNFNGKSKAIRDGQQWRNTYKLEGANESADDIRTAENYFAALKTDYKLDEKSYLFNLLEYTDDRFSGYNYEYSVTFGYGRVLIENASHKLSADLGLGYRFSEFDAGYTDEDAVARVGGLYKWTISESTVFDEEVSSEIGEEKHTTKSLTRLQMKVNGNLWGFVAYEIKRTSEVPAGVKNSDRKTSVGLNYAF